MQTFKCRKPQKTSTNKKGKKSKVPEAEITFRVESKQGEEALTRAFAEGGGFRKVDTAPKGTLEREEQRLLNTFRKGCFTASAEQGRCSDSY